MENTNLEEIAVETAATPENQEATTPVKKSFAQKLKSVKKSVWIAIALVVVVLIGGLIAWSILSNTYETPIKLYVAEMNSRKAPKTVAGDLRQLNGLAEKEIKEIFAILNECDDAEEWIEHDQDSFEERMESREDAHGKNWKYTYKIDDREELEKADLRANRDLLRNHADQIESAVEKTKEWNSDDWEQAADRAGLTKSQIKSLIKKLEALGKVLKSVKVTDGYLLCGSYSLSGSDTDEPWESEFETEVCKVNGRWVSVDDVASIIQFLRLTMRYRAHITIW